MKPELLTTKQVAARFGVRPRTVTRWVNAGRLTVAQKLDGPTGANLFDSKAVDRFARELEAAS